MELDYKKTYTIELLNEYSASVYNRVLNYVLNNDIDKNNVTNIHANLLQQLKIAKRVNYFDQSMEDLEKAKSFWIAMDHYSKSIQKKKVVA